jgi:hypothetical protein
MIRLKNITLRNFLSIGQVTQAVNFDRKELTLILGENLDLGGDGARNGTGKCVGINTIVRVRNTLTGEICSITMGELYEAAKIYTDPNNR